MKSHAAAIIILNFFYYVIGLCLIIGSFLYFSEVLVSLTVARKVTVVYICSVSSSDLGEQKVPVTTVNWSSSCAASFKRLCSVMAREYSSVDKILQKVNLKKIQAKHLSDQCFI